MKIKQVRVYQSVPFKGVQNSYFNAVTEGHLGKTAGKLDIMEMDNGCVLVSDGVETIKIGMANVAVIVYDSAVKPEAPKAKKA